MAGRTLAAAIFATILFSGNLLAGQSLESLRSVDSIRRADQYFQDHYLEFIKQIDALEGMSLGDTLRNLDQNIAKNRQRIRDSAGEELAAQYFAVADEQMQRLRKLHYASSVIASIRKGLTNRMLSENYIFKITYNAARLKDSDPIYKYVSLVRGVLCDLIDLPLEIILTTVTTTYEVLHKPPRTCKDSQ